MQSLLSLLRKAVQTFCPKLLPPFLQPRTISQEMLTDYIKRSEIPVIWVLGGPGTGKGTQCTKVVEYFGFTHFSTGAMLRHEVVSGSDQAVDIQQIMDRGELVPCNIVLNMLKNAMLAHIEKSKGFLIDGWPREVSQAESFESEIYPVHLLIFFEASDATMQQRLMERGRSDDNKDSIKNRIATFNKTIEFIVDKYKQKCKKISAERSEEEIFADVCRELNKLLDSRQARQRKKPQQ